MEKFNYRFKRYIDKLKKYKYSLIILVFGIALMCIPIGKKSSDKQNSSKTKTTSEGDYFERDLQKELESILGQIEGVGNVSVLITYDMSQKNIYQQDTRESVSVNGEEIEYQTVWLSQNGDDEPLIVCTKYPTCRGVVVVCQGAERAATKLAVIQAVSDLTGLSSEHISVIKMKGS